MSSVAQLEADIVIERGYFYATRLKKKYIIDRGLESDATPIQNARRHVFCMCFGHDGYRIPAPLGLHTPHKLCRVLKSDPKRLSYTRYEEGIRGFLEVWCILLQGINLGTR